MTKLETHFLSPSLFLLFPFSSFSLLPSSLSPSLPSSFFLLPSFFLFPSPPLWPNWNRPPSTSDVPRRGASRPDEPRRDAPKCGPTRPASVGLGQIQPRPDSSDLLRSKSCASSLLHGDLFSSTVSSFAHVDL